MLYKYITYEYHKKGSYVITYADFGTTFYILVKGSVAVRIPILTTKEFSLREMLEFFVENKEWLIKNERMQHLFVIVQDFIPEIIRSGNRGNLSINFDLTEKVVSGKIILQSQGKFKNFFPNFTDMKKYKDL